MLHRLAAPLHDPRLVALVDELALFPPRTRERGRAYAADRRVAELVFEDGFISASVQGTTEYRTVWEWSRGNGWQPLCTCPVGDFCKHAYALGCAVLDRARSAEGFDDARLARLLPSRDAALPARPRLHGVRGGVTNDALHRLRTGRAEWERQSALDRLLVGAPAIGLSPYAPPLIDMLREPD